MRINFDFEGYRKAKTKAIICLRLVQVIYVAVMAIVIVRTNGIQRAGAIMVMPCVILLLHNTIDQIKYKIQCKKEDYIEFTNGELVLNVTETKGLNVLGKLKFQIICIERLKEHRTKIIVTARVKRILEGEDKLWSIYNREFTIYLRFKKKYWKGLMNFLNKYMLLAY